MKRYIVAIIVVLIAFFAFGFYKLKERKEEYARLEKPKLYPFTVSVVKPVKGTLDVYETYRGYYEALDKGVLASKVAGILEKVLVKEGDRFSKGETLAIIDPTDLKAKIQASEAKLEALKASAQAAKIAVDTQKSIYERNLKLFKTGGISKEALQLSKSTYMQAEAQYKKILAQIETTKAEIESLKETLNRYAKITAPYDGVVTKLIAREGSFVVAGRPILGIEGIKNFRILVQVPKETSVGDSAILETGKGKEILKVSKIFPSAENDLKIVEIRVHRLNIPTDSFVDIKLLTRKCEGFIVPTDAILYLNKGTFVVSEHSKAIPVKVEALTSTKACVKGNLDSIKGVIVAGQYRLREIALHHYPIRVKQ